MIPAVHIPIVRRAILDLLDAIGGAQNDDVTAALLREIGYQHVTRVDVREQGLWLRDQGLVTMSRARDFVLFEIAPDGIDLAAGLLKVEGVSPHKTGRH